MKVANGLLKKCGTVQIFANNESKFDLGGN
jgi:hypothetical protein